MSINMLILSAPPSYLLFHSTFDISIVTRRRGALVRLIYVGRNEVSSPTHTSAERILRLFNDPFFSRHRKIRERNEMRWDHKWKLLSIIPMQKKIHK
jgi:DNA-binding transcriptional regulator PaaX